jgi:hypothetical protein
MKIGVCIRAKDEIIMDDWIRYYTYLGFDKIIIYDNMSNPPIKTDNYKNRKYNQLYINYVLLKY